MRALPLAILALGCLGVVSPAFAGTGADVSKPDARPPLTERKPEPVYSVVAGIDGEIYPVFANYASLRSADQRKWGTVAVSVNNPTADVLRARIAVTVQGWSDQEIQLAQLQPGTTKTYIFAPTFLPRFYANHEIVAATTLVSVMDNSGHPLYLQTVPVKIRSSEDMFWGSKFQYAPFIASWITPHDQRVEEILRQAKEFMPGRRLPGYEPEKSVDGQEQMTYSEARAIYRALQDAGVSYVKSSMTFGDHQDWSERVRMPEDSLREVSANCIDGVVMYASLFENLGMDSVVLLVPGHAYFGVRLSPRSAKFLYIETAITGRASFEESIASAARGVASYKPNDTIRVSVADARSMGVFPMPAPAVGAPPPPKAVNAALQLGMAKSRP
jgi:hypothetical protein